MARTIPSPTSGRTIPAPEAGGGGGGGNPWKEWVDVDLSKVAPGLASEWVTLLGSGGTSTGATATYASDVLTITFPGGANIRETGSTHNGLWLVKKLHLDPWGKQATPAGQPANQFQPESTMLKVEMAFDTTHGPINGDSSSGNYGHYLTAGCGLSQYSSDQSGNPGFPGADSFAGAYVLKNQGGEPSASTNSNMFRAGSSSYNIKLNTNHGTLWRGQSGATGATNFDAVLFHAGFNSPWKTGTNVQILQGGGYATADPFGDMVAPNASYAGNSSKLSNNRFLHLALWFGSDDNASARRGTIKIRRLRYILQPLTARADLE